MAAIAGLHGRPSEGDAETGCRRMLAAQLAYGPSGAFLWSEADVAFGHTSSTEMSGARGRQQPLVSDSRRYVLVADLRLDNREDLLVRLGRRGPESTRWTDAEIVLRAWEAWGERTLDLLNGDYAIAVWDRSDRTLFLARDPFGHRPLFFCWGRGFFAFSSMPKGMHALPEVVRAPDPEAMALHLALVPEMGRTSYYKDIEQLPPGHLLTLEGGSSQLRRFWKPEPNELKLRSFGEYVEAFRAQLDRSVRVRLRGAEAKVAAHLSGGWDSSAVVATAARQAGPSCEILAFTSVPARSTAAFDPANFISDESEIAARVAAIYPSVRHRRVEAKVDVRVERLDALVELYDRPVYNLFNQFWMTEINRQASAAGAHVLLSGRLGNFTISAASSSVLAEYIQQRRWRDWLVEARGSVGRKNLRRRGVLASSFRPWIPNRLWAGLQHLSTQPPRAENSALHPSWQGRVEEIRKQKAAPPTGGDATYFKRTLWAMSHYELGNYRKGNLAGWNIDERDPTADRELVEFCLSLPVDMLLKDGVRRPLAYAALSDRLPPAVLDERRKGFQAADWYVGLSASLPSIQALLEEIAANPIAASVMDIERLRYWLRDWPRSDWAKPATLDRYRSALPNALLAGHFILHASR